jgi:UDP-perosamine 4-acetyltransferase
MEMPLIIVGGGGHARVLVDLLRRQGREILGFTDPCEGRPAIQGIPWLGDDERIFHFNPEHVRLVNGVGSTGSTRSRRAIYARCRERQFVFERVTDPSAVIAGDVTVAEAAQILAGVIVQPGSRIGANTILNTRASIDHDCQIGPHVHVAPGAVLSGGIQVGEGAHVGVGATIIQGIRIGRESIIGAGAVVIRDVPDGVTVMGVPARVRESEKNAYAA